MGWWYDRSGAGPVTLLGLTMISVGAMLVSAVDSRWQLYLVFGVMLGLLGYASIYGPLTINVMRWFRHRPGFAVGVVTAGEGLGGTFWPPVFRYFNETAGWRDTFLWFGVFVLVTALPLSAVLWRRRPARDAGSRGRRWTASSMRPPRRRGPLSGQSACRHSRSRPRSAWPSSDAASPWRCRSRTSSRTRATSATPRHGRRRCSRSHCSSRPSCGSWSAPSWSTASAGLVALLVFSGLQTAALLLYAAADGLLALYAVSVLFGIGYGGVNICYPVLVREHLPRAEAGRRLGVILLFGTLGMALGGWLAGYIFDSTGGYMLAFLAGAAFNVTNLTIVVGLIIRTRAGGGASMRPVAA